MNAKFAQTLVVVSMGAFAVAEKAQNNTPRYNPTRTHAYKETQQGTKPGSTDATERTGGMGRQTAHRSPDSAETRH